MWILDSVQSTIKRNLENAFNLEQKSSTTSILTLQIIVDCCSTEVIVTVPNWTSVIALKNLLRQRKIINRSNEETTIIFNNSKLENCYWTLRDYDLPTSARLFVRYHMAIPVEKEPSEPAPLGDVDDEVRRALVRKRLDSRRIGDVFNFALLHTLYDPSSLEASYDRVQDANCGALKTSSQIASSKQKGDDSSKLSNLIGMLSKPDIDSHGGEPPLSKVKQHSLEAKKGKFKPPQDEKFEARAL